MAKAAKKILEQSGFRESKNDNDTVRLWENYREQALLWRALALFQIPATCIAIVFAIIIFHNRETILNVPARPLPGFYQAEEITDEEFISRTIEFVNLVATYQPLTARRQFEKAAEYLIEPMLSRFQTDMIGTELQAIETTSRTQVYWVDPTKTEIYRDEGDGNVVVNLVGERKKIVAGQELPDVITQFRVHLTTIPRNTINKNGIVIKNVETTSTEARNLMRKRAR